MGSRDATGAIVSLFLAAAVIVAAALLAWRQRNERRRREGGGELSEADARHFARQDVRRFLGAAMMVVLALGIVAGSWIDPRVAVGLRRLFVAIWAAVFLLLLALLGLAWADWKAIGRYARRQRRELVAGHLAAVQAERERAGQGDVARPAGRADEDETDEWRTHRPWPTPDGNGRPQRP